jgi:hypothetical protein
LTPRSGKGKNSGFGSGMKTGSESLKTICWVKTIEFFYADPGWEKFGSGMEKFGSEIFLWLPSDPTSPNSFFPLNKRIIFC